MLGHFVLLVSAIAMSHRMWTNKVTPAATLHKGMKTEAAISTASLDVQLLAVWISNVDRYYKDKEHYWKSSQWKELFKSLPILVTISDLFML